MKAYKGFNEDMTCRGFQFKEGETYTEDKAELCKSGFHACERPLDTFAYYPPCESVYHEVELDDVCEKSKEGDTKICGKRIRIGAALDIKGLVSAQFEYVKAHCTNEHTNPKIANAGDCGAAIAGDCGAANAGDCGAANAGRCGAANAGDWGAANAGRRGAANAGHRGAANAGSCGAANAGRCGAANAGDWGAANAGRRGAANAGSCGAAISRGAAEVGKGGVAVARGEVSYDNKVRGKMGAILVIAHEKEFSYEIENWAVGVVDGVNLKPDVWYKLVDGELVEV